MLSEPDHNQLWSPEPDFGQQDSRPFLRLVSVPGLNNLGGAGAKLSAILGYPVQDLSVVSEPCAYCQKGRNFKGKTSYIQVSLNTPPVGDTQRCY